MQVDPSIEGVFVGLLNALPDFYCTGNGTRLASGRASCLVKNWSSLILNGIIVNLSIDCRQNFIRLPATEELLKLFKRGRYETQLEANIRLEVALQALREGSTFVDIMQTTVWQLEKEVIEQILRFTNGNKSETARILKVDYKTLYRKMNRYF